MEWFTDTRLDADGAGGGDGLAKSFEIVRALPPKPLSAENHATRNAVAQQQQEKERERARERSEPWDAPPGEQGGTACLRECMVGAA